MKVIYPTSQVETQGIKIFLAGTIDMGNSINWQQKIIEDFENLYKEREIIILNPRRENWDSDWIQTIENKQFSDQVNWELDALEKSDFIIMFFDKNSKSPISMLELGLFADSKKILVCCEEGFWRKGNIDIVCKRKKIPAFKSLDDLITALKLKLIDMKYSIEKLATENQGAKYLFFWGHQPNKDGSISKTCFSQWWLSSFEVDGIIYKTAEHWMMAKKAELFNDKEVLEKIIQAKSPAEAKKLGREVKNYVDTIWLANRFEIVKEGNLHKFSQNKDLKEFLLNTNERILVEASPIDPIWGIGMAADDKEINNPEKWKGLNLLGFALMEVRDELK